MYQLLVAKASEFFARREYENALHLYNAALVFNSDHETLNQKGNVLRLLGRHEEAIAAYDLALAIKPYKHEALNNKGVALRKLERCKEAISAYNAALAIKPDDAKTLRNKKAALSSLKKE